MQKIIKWIFLFLLIGLPVCIYLFLKAFGENKFEIPVYYQNGIENRVETCDNISGQYLVPNLLNFDSTLTVNLSGIIIYNLGQVKGEERLKKSNNLIMLTEKADDWHGVNLYTSNEKSLGLLVFMRCGLNLNANLNRDSLIKNHKLVLVDKQKRVRGYYNMLEREEIDRLITEVNILLKE